MSYEMDGVKLHFDEVSLDLGAALFVCIRCGWERKHIRGDRMTEGTLRFHELRCPNRWALRAGCVAMAVSGMLAFSGEWLVAGVFAVIGVLYILRLRNLNPVEIIAQTEEWG